METSSVTLVTLTPSVVGNFLTQSDPGIPIEARVLATEITLAQDDTPDQWQEISAEEAESLKAQINEAIKQKMP